MMYQQIPIQMAENREYTTACQAKQRTDNIAAEKYTQELMTINGKVIDAINQGKYETKIQNIVLQDELQLYLTKELGYNLSAGYDPPLRGETNLTPYVIISWSNPNCV